MRRRVAGWVRRLYYEGKFRTWKDMAEELGVDPGHLSAVKNSKTGAGLDLVWRLSKTFRDVSMSTLCDRNPGEEWLPPPPAEKPPPIPIRASPATAQPRKRKPGGEA